MRVRNSEARRAAGLEAYEHDGPGINGAFPAPSSVDDTTLQAYASACEWRRLNPTVWREWEKQALAHATKGQCFSMASLVQAARWKDRVNSNGEPVRVNNNYSPIWARMLAAEHPEVEPYIQMRHSKYAAFFDEGTGRGQD